MPVQLLADNNNSSSFLHHQTFVYMFLCSIVMACCVCRILHPTVHWPMFHLKDNICQCHWSASNKLNPKTNKCSLAAITNFPIIFLFKIKKNYLHQINIFMQLSANSTQGPCVNLQQRSLYCPLTPVILPFPFAPFSLLLSPHPPSPPQPLSSHSSSPHIFSHLPSLFHLCSPRLSFPLPHHLFIQYGRPISAGSFPREQDF